MASPVSGTPPRNVPFYASLLDAISAAKDLPALLRAHARLLTAGLSSHAFLHSKLCSAYARCRVLTSAHLLLSSAARRPAFLFNSLLRSHAALSHPLQALFVLHLMLRRGHPLSLLSLPPALRAAASLPSLPLGCSLHAAAIARGLSHQIPTSLISMYSKCADLPSARHLFDRALADATAALSTWTAMISALGSHGHHAEAVDLFDRLAAPVDPPAVTAVLAACARGGFVERGREVFTRMRAGDFGPGAGPTVEHYTCMVDLLGRKGYVEEAEALVGEMEGEPDEALWGALLGACRAHGRLDVAERVANRVYGGKVKLDGA